VQRLALDHDLGIMELDASGLRKEHDVPLAAYIAGAEAIRQKTCNATDLYPTLSPESPDGESIDPLPLRLPDSVTPEDTEALPEPQNPANNVEPSVHLASGSADGNASRVIRAYAELPVAASSGEILPLALPPVAQ
jgi:hypothetical protein